MTFTMTLRTWKGALIQTRFQRFLTNLGLISIGLMSHGHRTCGVTGLETTPSLTLLGQVIVGCVLLIALLIAIVLLVASATQLLLSL